MISVAPKAPKRDDDRGSFVPPTAPVEPFEDLRNRRYRTLIDAGIDADMAWEVASFNAVETMRAKMLRAVQADDYESSPQVYGE